MANATDPKVAVERLEAYLKSDVPNYPEIMRDAVTLLVHLYRRPNVMETYVDQTAQRMRRQAGVPVKQVKLHGGELPPHGKRRP